ncbi:MAG: nitroreductase family protein [Candidatus Geothermarchaeales archaeon]
MTEASSLFEAIHGLRAVRRFRPDPVEDDKIREILGAAVMAPNAGNAQPWRFIVVRNHETRVKIREIAVRAWRQLVRYIQTPAMARGFDEGRLMVENTDKVPVLIFVFGDTTPYVESAKRLAKIALKLRVPRAWRQLNLNLSASVYPAVQNILLSARGLGLGTCLTTSIILREREVKQVLKVPKELRLFSLIYLGYPAVALRPPTRRPVEEFIYSEGWS